MPFIRSESCSFIWQPNVVTWYRFTRVEDTDADRLYGMELEAFVPERSALARRLRADGRREEAAAVAKLPKPSAAAWAVNQVVRTQRSDARALWEAGDALLAAQEALLAGSGDGAGLRAASGRVQEALVPLLAAARGLLDGRGRALSEATLAKVAETLHAAAIDPEAREEVAAGRAVRELVHVGLGAVAAPSARARPKRPVEEEPAPERPALGGAKRRGGRAKEREAEERATREREAEERATREREAEERATRERAAAEERAEAQRAEARRAAERCLRDAVAAREAAEADVRAVEEALEGARARLDEARQRESDAASALTRLLDGD